MGPAVKADIWLTATGGAQQQGSNDPGHQPRGQTEQCGQHRIPKQWVNVALDRRLKQGKFIGNQGQSDLTQRR